MTFSYHKPILVDEVIEALLVADGKRYIDATLGGGGHAKAIAAAGGMVLGIDQDEDAIGFVRSQHIERLKVVSGNFRELSILANTNGFTQVDGVIMDLGVSSHQLDTGERGFSFRFPNAPLDMRMDTNRLETAADIVNRASEKELYEIFATYGEEERAGTISSVIVRTRSLRPVVTIGDMLRILDELGIRGIPLKGIQTRVFQALRIAVNDELGALREGLQGAGEVIKHGGVLAVITFHSLEDRVVKRVFQTARWETVHKKPILPSVIELQRNPRARSAKLRIARRIWERQ